MGCLYDAGLSHRNAHVQRITRRLTAQLTTQQEVRLALDGAEIDALLEALHGFGHQIEELFPHTPQRDLAVATLPAWQQRVVDLLMGAIERGGGNDGASR